MKTKQICLTTSPDLPSLNNGHVTWQTRLSSFRAKLSESPKFSGVSQSFLGSISRDRR